MGGQSQQKPSYSQYEHELFSVPSGQITYRGALGLAIKKGFPDPAGAANEVMKKVDQDSKRLKESLPSQPTGTTQLDVPLAQTIRDIIPQLNYLQAAPIQSPLGMQGELPMTIQDIISSLPPDYQLPSPIQGQQPELSLFGPGALAQLPQQTTQPYIASDIAEKVLAARTRPAGISQIPTGLENITYITDPVTGRPTERFATAPRQILTPEQAAFEKLTPAEQKEKLLKADIEIKMPSPGERKELVEAGQWQDMLGNYKASYDNAKSSLGPAVGRVKYLQYLKGGGYGLSKSEINFFANEATVTNRIIQLITGAAVGTEEEKRIRAEIPSHTDTPAQWEIKHKATLKNIVDLENRIKKTMKDYGIGSPENKPTGTIEWQQ